MADDIQVYDNQQGVSGSIQIRTMEDLSRVSKMLAASRFFTDAIDAAQCGTKVLAGAEMGFGAFASMTGIHIIKGKPSIGANLMAAAVKRHPNYNYRVLEHSDQVCRIAFYERWDGRLEQVGVSEFTIEQARKAQTQNLDKYARNMLFARAMSNGVKWYCPDVFDAPVYTPEELGVATDGEGNVIEAQVSVVDDAPTHSPYISDAQLKRYMAIATKHKWSQEAQKGLLFGLGIKTRKEIPVDVYDEVISTLETQDPSDFESAGESIPVAAEVA